jgi:hypothetical protein
MAQRTLIGLMALAGVAAIDGRTAVAHADVPGVIAESARTAADSVRDSVRTLARTTHAFVFGGVPAAEDAWENNVEEMRERARRNADRVREEAGIASRRAYPEYDDGGEYYRYDDRDYRDDDYNEYRRDEPLPPDAPHADGY